MKTKLLFAIAAAGLWACAPSVDQTASPSSVTIAVFDPTTSSIPLPSAEISTEACVSRTRLVNE